MYVHTCADPERVAGGPDIPLKNHEALMFLSKTGLDSLKHHKATKLAFIVGPSSARQRNAIPMAFRWHADGGLLLVLFEPSLLPSSTKKRKKKNVVKGRPPLTKLTGSAHFEPYGRDNIA